MNPTLRQSLGERQPQWLQALSFVPAERQAATGWLWLVLDDMLQTALLPSQTHNARLKLGWWQEQLQQPGHGGHPALQGLRQQAEHLLRHPAWADWFHGCEQLLQQETEAPLVQCQQAWTALEGALDPQAPAADERLPACLARETALAQQKNRIRFGLPGMGALADLPAELWAAPEPTHPAGAEADRRLRQLADQALPCPRQGPLATILRGRLAQHRLEQWRKRGLKAYNGLSVSPWRSLLGLWLCARQTRSRT